MTAHGIMFHHFHSEVHIKGQGAISADELVRIIEYLGPENILSAEEWGSKARKGELAANELCLTFDDALLCQYDVAFPVLTELGLTAFWFVYSSVFEGHLETLEIYRYFRTSEFSSIDDFYDSFSKSVAQAYPDEFEIANRSFDSSEYLTEFPFYSSGDRLFRYLRDECLGTNRYSVVMLSMMEDAGFDGQEAAQRLWMNNSHLDEISKSGHVIGLHSYSHPTRMVELTQGEQRDQYRTNLDHLERVTNEQIACMSHPCNSYDDTTLSVLEELGMTLGFRSNMMQMPNPGKLEFPREDHANLMKVLSS